MKNTVIQLKIKGNFGRQNAVVHVFYSLCYKAVNIAVAGSTSENRELFRMDKNSKTIQHDNKLTMHASNWRGGLWSLKQLFVSGYHERAYEIYAIG